MRGSRWTPLFRVEVHVGIRLNSEHFRLVRGSAKYGYNSVCASHLCTGGATTEVQGGAT